MTNDVESCYHDDDKPEKWKTLHLNRTFALLPSNSMHCPLRESAQLKLNILRPLSAIQNPQPMCQWQSEQEKWTLPSPLKG